MARKKTTRVFSERTQNNPSFLSQLRFGESYTSLVLGIIVVITVAILVTAFTRTFQKTGNLEKTDTLSQKTVEESLKQAETKQHIVTAGENLWEIAEKTYNSGYNWVDIAKANNLENPDVILTGTKLILPLVEPKMVTVVEKIEGTSYTVKEGDSLWEVAVRRYGDGYKWTEIAKQNSLLNPNILHVGITLKLP